MSGARPGSTERRAIELLVLQPTPFCNLDCDYCYLANRQTKARMSPEVLRGSFERVLASSFVGKKLTVVWHAGEPLTVPVRFYEEAFDLARSIAPPSLELHHALQTNATLIDERWCEFFRDRRVRVGVSLDGPAFLHDAHRKTRKGSGTHATAMRGVRLLQAAGIDFHVISVLTGDSLRFPVEMFRFFVGSGIRRVGFNVEEIEGGHRTSSLESALFGNEVQTFFRSFIALNRDAGHPLAIRELEALGGLVFGGDEFLSSTQENEGFRIVSVDWQGNLSTFSPELLGNRAPEYRDFVLGNVLHDDLESISGSVEFRRLDAEIQAGLKLCRDGCPYFGVCGGGSPGNKFFENGTFASAETLHCTLSKKAVTDVLLDHFEAELHRLQAGEMRVSTAQN